MTVHILKTIGEDLKFVALCGDKVSGATVIATFARVASCQECTRLKVEEIMK